MFGSSEPQDGEIEEVLGGCESILTRKSFSHHHHLYSTVCSLEDPNVSRAECVKQRGEQGARNGVSCEIVLLNKKKVKHHFICCRCGWCFLCICLLVQMWQKE